MSLTYLDHNATTDLRPAARSAMLAALETGGNASSAHRQGRAARAMVEQARREIAQVLAVSPADLVFTSGATEALNMVLQPSDGHRRLLVGATEHSAVLDGHRFAQVDILPVDCHGCLLPATLEQALASSAPDEAKCTVVAIQLANNETGVIQPIAELAAIARQYGASFVCDAVQGAGRLDLQSIAALVDALIISSHKVGGPQGAGALYLAPQSKGFQPLIRGGGQERRRRAGTENVAAIAGFAAALKQVEAERTDEMSRLAKLRDRFESALKEACPDAICAGQGADRLANTSLVVIPGLLAETAVIAFDIEGFAVSAGAACSSGKVAASHVLQAMGLSHDLARAGLRISLGWTSTEADIDRLVIHFPKLVERLVKSRREHAA